MPTRQSLGPSLGIPPDFHDLPGIGYPAASHHECRWLVKVPCNYGFFAACCSLRGRFATGMASHQGEFRDSFCSTRVKDRAVVRDGGNKILEVNSETAPLQLSREHILRCSSNLPGCVW